MTRLQLKQYIRKKLGEPVINVDIDDSQLEILIDEAMQLFMENHYDGTDVGYVTLTLTTTTLCYTLPNTVQEVVDIYTGNTYIGADDEESLVQTDTMLVSGNYIDYQVIQQSIQSAFNTYEKTIMYDYNSTSKKFTLHAVPDDISYPYILKCYVSESNYDLIYNNLWLKKYCVAIAKIQWATNLGKYVGGVLPGGASLNYDSILNEGKTERELLELELREKYTMPTDFEMA